MRCQVCGMNYIDSHSCTGMAPQATLEEAELPPDGIAPGYYLRMAVKVATCDGEAIRRASNDADSLSYGVVFSTICATIIFLATALPKMLTREGATAGTIFWGLLLGLVFVWLYMSVIALIQIGLCHLIVRWFLGATGTFFGVIRPLLLAWFVNCLILIPVIGAIAAALVWTIVMTRVFEEVEGIGRLPAFLVSAGVNTIFVTLQLVFAR